MISNLVRLGFAAVLLAACANSPATTSAFAPATPAGSPTATPGPNPVNPADAGALFAQLCVANLPTFAGTPQALATRPFAFNPTANVYYHNTLNLGVRLDRDACEMTFITEDDTPADEFRDGAEATGIGAIASADAAITQGPLGGTLMTISLPAQ